MLRKLVIAAAMLTAFAAPASATVTFTSSLSGTGDNVIFNSLSGATALGSLNGQHQELVEFKALDVATFNAASNGQDIKINGTNNLQIEVHDQLNSFVIGTTTQVFSIKGDGHLFAFVRAVDMFGVPEAVQNFDLGVLGNGQNGFTFKATDGEVMTRLTLLVQGGTMEEFEHYRIDVGIIPLADGVPEASTWAMMFLGFAGIGLTAMRRKRKNERLLRLA